MNNLFKPKFIAIGSAIVDTEYRVTELQLKDLELQKGSMSLVSAEQLSALEQKLSDKIAESCGGSAANTAYCCSGLGVESGFICRLGADAQGELFQQEMAAAKVTVNSKAQFSDGSTGKCLVLISEDGERTMCTSLGVNVDLSIDNIEQQWLSADCIVFLESYLVTSESSKAAAKKLIALAKQQGAKVAISLSDANLVTAF